MAKFNSTTFTNLFLTIAILIGLAVMPFDGACAKMRGTEDGSLRRRAQDADSASSIAISSASIAPGVVGRFGVDGRKDTSKSKKSKEEVKAKNSKKSKKSKASTKKDKGDSKSKSSKKDKDDSKSKASKKDKDDSKSKALKSSSGGKNRAKSLTDKSASKKTTKE